MKKMRSGWFFLAVTSCGFPPLPPPVVLELIAGDIGGPGSLDGTGTTARFGAPSHLAVDSAGSVYVADWHYHTIRKITAGGVVTTLAGTAAAAGDSDGPGAAAHFFHPSGVAVDSTDNVYVADGSNHTIRKVTARGVVTTLAGTAGLGGSEDGMGAEARFSSPSDVAVDGTGNVYVADQSNHTIRKITSAGVVTTLAGTAGMSGSTDNTGAAARFDSPSGIAVDGAGNVYVADDGNHTLRKVTAAGVVTTLAGTADNSGSADGTGAAARFDSPSDVAVDSTGNVYVADRDNHTIRKVTAAGAVTTLAGTASMSGSADGKGAVARFFSPWSVAVDSAGNAYVADNENHAIRKVTAAGAVTTLAGTASHSGSADGAGAAARFNTPWGVAVDSAGDVHVVDEGNHTIRKVTAAGVVTTRAGSAGMFDSTDGPGADARFGSPSGNAVDRAGNVYVADEDNHTIRKITAAGVVTTLAGAAGSSGAADGTGAAARFNGPADVAVDSTGNVYVADAENHAIRKVTAAGVVTTLAGNADISGGSDGTGADARFNLPIGVAVDIAGNVYVVDKYNHNIRKVSTAGVVTTLAGTAGMSGSADGTGAEARFGFPTDVAVDSAGNVYVADSGNHTVRKVTPTGSTTTIAGDAGVAGILLGVTPRFGSLASLAIAGDSIVITDTDAILVLHHGAQ